MIGKRLPTYSNQKSRAGNEQVAKTLMFRPHIQLLALNVCPRLWLAANYLRCVWPVPVPVPATATSAPAPAYWQRNVCLGPVSSLPRCCCCSKFCFVYKMYLVFAHLSRCCFSLFIMLITVYVFVSVCVCVLSLPKWEYEPSRIDNAPMVDRKTAACRCCCAFDRPLFTHLFPIWASNWVSKIYQRHTQNRTQLDCENVCTADPGWNQMDSGCVKWFVVHEPRKKIT